MYIYEQHFSLQRVDLLHVETQLKKRWSVDYKWGRRQANIWDSQTNFIYTIPNFDDVLTKIATVFHSHSHYKAIRNYALNRWYNFQSSIAVEQIFNEHKRVRKVQYSKDREKDFYIDGIPFDLKTSVYPAGYDKPVDVAISDPTDLAKWLYVNQSKQARFHQANRLFLVLHKKEGEHWKLKAELSWIKLLIDTYLDDYDETKLIQLKHSVGIVKTDIILGCR